MGRTPRRHDHGGRNQPVREWVFVQLVGDVHADDPGIVGVYITHQLYEYPFSYGLIPSTVIVPPWRPSHSGQPQKTVVRASANPLTFPDPSPALFSPAFPFTM